MIQSTNFLVSEINDIRGVYKIIFLCYYAISLRLIQEEMAVIKKITIFRGLLLFIIACSFIVTVCASSTESDDSGSGDRTWASKKAQVPSASSLPLPAIVTSSARTNGYDPLITMISVMVVVFYGMG